MALLKTLVRCGLTKTSAVGGLAHMRTACNHRVPAATFGFLGSMPKVALPPNLMIGRSDAFNGMSGLPAPYSLPLRSFSTAGGRPDGPSKAAWPAACSSSGRRFSTAKPEGSKMVLPGTVVCRKSAAGANGMAAWPAACSSSGRQFSTAAGKNPEGPSMALKMCWVMMILLFGHGYLSLNPERFERKISFNVTFIKLKDGVPQNVISLKTSEVRWARFVFGSCMIVTGTLLVFHSRIPMKTLWDTFWKIFLP